MKFNYTEEMKQFLFENYKGRTSVQLAEMFNEKFGTERLPRHMSQFRKNNNLISGITGRFEKGQNSWNKGTRGLMRANRTTFKKGNRPANYADVGTEVMKADGYIWVKIEAPNIWKQKHRILWEEVNGPIPENHLVIFLDQNHENVQIDNLILVSRKVHGVMNKKGFYSGDPELTKAALQTVKVISKVRQIEKMEEKK